MYKDDTARELKDCVNELCLRCGDYKQEHLGACEGCRWLEVRRRDIGGDAAKHEADADPGGRS
jgi:hypothetical protein